HLGTSRAPVPVIFGMNFQAVSVGQKLIENGVKGGDTHAIATPTDPMRDEIRFVDAAVGQMLDALADQRLLGNTARILTAKHGQAPIDTNRFFPIPGHANTTGHPPSELLAADLPDSEVNQIGPTEDDISLLWLKPGSNTAADVAILEANAA